MVGQAAPAPRLRRREFVVVVIGAFAAAAARAQGTRHFRIAFANLNEEPGVHLEGLGFTGVEVRRSFELASRTLPVDVSASIACVRLPSFHSVQWR